MKTPAYRSSATDVPNDDSTFTDVIKVLPNWFGSPGNNILAGGSGVETVDYSMLQEGSSIVANLATGKVDKDVVATPTSVHVGALGRYIRIYRKNDVSDGPFGMPIAVKVYAGGVEVAPGKTQWSGYDRVVDYTFFNFYSNSYIELDLKDSYSIDSITLSGYSTDNNNLRMYVSNKPFSNSSQTAYDDLAVKAGVSRVDMVVVGTGALRNNFTDTLTGIENLVGTAMADSLTGDGNANILSGGAGKDTLDGGAGGDTVYGGDGDDLIRQGMDQSADSLDGGNDIDTVDYSAGGTAGNIVANLATGTVNKVVAGITFTDCLTRIENLVGTALADSLTGDDNANTLAGGAGADVVNGGDGDDLIRQDMERGGDTLAGGNGNDTVDYSATNLAGKTATGIKANLATGKADKVFAGTAVDLKATGRYIRIYHTNAASSITLSLTGLKVYAGGKDVAAGLGSGIGADIGSVDGRLNNSWALTDAAVGGATSTPTSNMAWANAPSGANKPYIELDLKDSYSIDSIALWGNVKYPAESNNLRVYVSNKSFAELTGSSPKTAYADLSAKADVARVDVAVVDTTPNTTFTDTLTGIENLVGTALADSLTGDGNANTLSGGASKDTLAAGAGADSVNGGDGDDTIRQDMGRFADTLNGGNDIDTVDYSISGMVGSIVAKLGARGNGQGMVSKVLAGTSISVGATGRYIRIYHTGAASATQLLTLTGLKVYAGGVDVAAGKPSGVGADGGGVGGGSYNNPWALTDNAVGGAWNGGTRPSTSNLANVTGNKPYIELDLGSVRAIDSISLWGHTNAPANSNNLRVYVSNKSFAELTGSSPKTAYADLAAKAGVARVDVAVVDTAPNTTFTDTLTDIENLVGTTLADSLTGDGNANTLSGGAGKDTLDGGAGNDILDGGAGDDVMSSGWGSDVIHGGDDDDTADYSTQGSIVANLVTGRVDKVVAVTPTSVRVGAVGRYIRIYHIDDIYTQFNTELTPIQTKVYANGVEVAADKSQERFSDELGLSYYYNNITYKKNYVELDLKDSYNIDSITLSGYSIGSHSLRVYVSNTPFADSHTAYDTLAADAAVARVDVALMGTGTIDAFTDTLTRVENLVGTATADSLTGDGNPNTLSGGAGNDTLDGGAGNDTLFGGAGADTYLFGRGGGADVVKENDATAGSRDVLRLGASIDATQVWLSKVNSDLVLSLIGTSDRVTFAGWYTGLSAHVEEIYAGNKKLLDTNVDKLVSAMATFSPPAAGRTSLPANLQSALQPVIAANWIAA